MRINRSYITNFNQILSADNLMFGSDAVTSSSSLSEVDGIIIKLIDATSGNVTITLPTAAGNSASFIIKKVDSSTNYVLIDGNASETIDGSTSITLYDQYNFVEIVSDGTNWKVINEFINNKW